MTLDSDNIRFMRIFAGVPWKGGVIQQCGNRKRVFLGVSAATYSAPYEMRPILVYIITYYYLVPCRLSTDPKIRDLV